MMRPVHALADQIRGVTYAKEDASSTPRPGSVAILRAGNIDGDSLTFEDLVYVPRARVSADQFLREHDILVATSSGSLDVVGKTAQALSDLDMGFGAFCKVLRPRSGIHPRYLGYFFRTAQYRGTISRLAAGANINNLRNAHLDDLMIPVPEEGEQGRIAAILDKADAIRRKRKEAFALAYELLRSTFLEMFGDPVTNPKRLERGALRDFLLMPLRNGLSPATGGQHKSRLLTLSAITRGAFDGGATKLGAFATDPWPDVRLDERDFLICRGNGNRDLVGAGAFPDRSDPSVVFPDTMIAARVDPHRVGKAFLDQLWKSRLVRRHVEASARTTNGTFKVNQGAIEATPILLPQAGDLARFESLALRQRALGARQRTAYEGSDALFESLVSRAFRGQLASASL